MTPGKENAAFWNYVFIKNTFFCIKSNAHLGFRVYAAKYLKYYLVLFVCSICFMCNHSIYTFVSNSLWLLLL